MEANGDGDSHGGVQDYLQGVPSPSANVDMMLCETPSSKPAIPQEARFSILGDSSNNVNGDATTAVAAPEDTGTETQNLMQQVKEAGTAGIVSYALWELGFWALSIPACVVGYQAATGHWPDLADPEDQKKLGAEAFAFVNVARFAVPLRLGLALGTAPWIDENVIRRFGKHEEGDEEGHL